MTKTDKLVALFWGLLFGVVMVVPPVRDAYDAWNANHGFVMSFAKFALLATFGECLALRITSGHYLRQGFGVLPKAVVWGLLGVIIKVAFIVFATGSPAVLGYAGLAVDKETLRQGDFLLRLITAFGVSVCMNMVFAPVLMTVHKITDEHIYRNGGRLSALWSPLDMVDILRTMDWNTMWHFVFKKTIPLFWIPAHTITFMLPAGLRVLFAALLGVALGVILAYAASGARADSREGGASLP